MAIVAVGRLPGTGERRLYRLDRLIVLTGRLILLRLDFLLRRLPNNSSYSSMVVNMMDLIFNLSGKGYCGCRCLSGLVKMVDHATDDQHTDTQNYGIT